MVDYTKLMYLLYIRKYCSFTKAAEELHITQPSLSIAIKNLELECGKKLINRTTRTVSLTPLGEEIANLAEQGFEYFNQIDTLLKEKNIKDSKKITIHCNSNLIEKLFINLSEFMSKNNSGIPIDVIPLDDDKTLDTLLSNNLDDYILTICSEHQRFPNNTQLSHLAQSKTFLAVSPNIKHSFKKILSIQDLLEIPLIIPQKKYSFQQYWSKKLEENGHPKIVYSSPDAKSINILANKGLGGVLYLDFNYFRTPTNLFLIPIKNSPTFYVTLLCSSKKEQNEISFLKSIIMQ